MLSDTIKSRLPATEAEILGSFGNIDRDYIRFHLRKLEREGKVKRYLDGIFRVFQRPDDEEDTPPPQYTKKERTCNVCGITYAGISKYFGSSNTCVKCRKKRKRVSRNALEKTCKICGTTYRGLRNHFRQYRVDNTNKSKQGGVYRKAFWKDICKTCEDRK